jgi:hypothetical protein
VEATRRLHLITTSLFYIFALVEYRTVNLDNNIGLRNKTTKILEHDFIQKYIDNL